MGLLDWLSDPSLFGGMGAVNSPSGVAPPPPVQQPQPVPPMAPSAPIQPGGGLPAGPTGSGPLPSQYIGGQPMQSPLQDGGGLPPGSEGMTLPPGGAPQGGAPPAAASVPLPQPRPAGAAAALPPNAAPTAGAGVPPGAAPAAAPAQVPPQAAPPIAPSAPASSPALTPIGRAFGLSPSEDGRVASSLAEGLKSVGTNYNKPALAALAGSAGSAMEGGQKKADTQQKQATDYLKAAIDAKKAGDEAGYKQNYLQYLAASLKQKTDAAANKDAAVNKNDTPTQLYLNAQRLVQNDPEVRDASKAVDQARKDGDAGALATAQANLQKIVQDKQAQHFSALGINPQTAAQLAKQPGNSQENPVDAGKMGITKDNIGKKLQPGQYFTNPADGKVYQYKGPPKSDDTKAPAKTPDKPTDPEPIDPLKPAKSPASAMAQASDDED